MGFTRIGYPSRVHKRKKHVRYYHYVEPAKVELSGADGGKGENQRNLPAPESLQDLPVEVLQRICAFSQDVCLMQSLNRYFCHTLEITDSLMGQMYETYIRDPVAEGLVSRSLCPEQEVMVSEEVFLNEQVLEYLDRNDEILSQVWTFLSPDPLIAGVQMEVRATVGMRKKDDYHWTFRNRYSRFFTQKKLIHRLKKYYTLSDQYGVMAGVLKWIFTTRTSHVKDLGDILDMLQLLETIGEDCDFESYEASEPLLVVIQLMFGGQYPPELKSYCDDIVRKSKSDRNNRIRKTRLKNCRDSRLLILEQILVHSYTDPDVSQCLSDYDLWSTLRRISNMQLIKLVEAYGGKPQYGLFL